MVKEIKLFNDKGIVLVDNEDYDKLIKYKWYIKRIKKRNSDYAHTKIKINGKWYNKLIHRIILNPLDSEQIDHIDCNGLNNQKNNLRIVTDSQNKMNRIPQKKSTSEFKGVYWYKEYNKWVSKIKKNKVSYHLGYFIDEIDAAKAYNEKAKELFKEYAYLNKV